MEPTSFIQIQNIYYFLLVLLVCRTCHAKPQPSLDINKLIDPLQQPDVVDELEDSNRRIKSVFNVPVLPSTENPRCPPGTQRTSTNGGECTAVAPKVSTDEVFLFKAIKSYYSASGGGKAPQAPPPPPPKPPKRRIRTTTTTTAKPEPAVDPIVHELPPPYDHSDSESNVNPPIPPARPSHVPVSLSPVIYDDFTTESVSTSPSSQIPPRVSKFPPSVFQFKNSLHDLRNPTTTAMVPTTTRKVEMETTPEIIDEETTPAAAAVDEPMEVSHFEEKTNHHDNFEEITILPPHKAYFPPESKFQQELQFEKEFREAWTMHFDMEKTTVYPGIVYDHIEMESVTMGSDGK